MPIAPIPTIHLESDGASPLLARQSLLQAVQQVNYLSAGVVSVPGDYSTLAEAASDAGAAGKTVVVTSPQVVTTAIAWPSDRELKFEKGGYITFSGAGALTGLKEYRPEMFGMNTNPGTTDMTATFTAAIACIKASTIRSPLILSATSYKTGPQLIDFPNFTMIGAGEKHTYLYPVADTDTMFSFGVYSATPTPNYWGGGAEEYSISGMSFIHSTGTVGVRTGTAIQDNGSGSGDISHVHFRGFSRGFWGAYGSQFTTIKDSYFTYCDVGAYFGRGSQQILVQNNRLEVNDTALYLETISQGTVFSNYFIENRSSCINLRNDESTTTASGVPNLVITYGTIVIDANWFEAGAGFGTGYDIKHLIVMRGNTTVGTLGGTVISNSYISAGTTGLSAKGAAPYSFINMYNGVRNVDVRSVVIGGYQFDYIVGHIRDNLSASTPSYTAITDMQTIDGTTPARLPFYFDSYITTTSHTDRFTTVNNTAEGYHVQRAYSNVWQKTADDTNGQKVISTSTDFVTWTTIAYDKTIDGQYMKNGRTTYWGTAMPTIGTYVQGDRVLFYGSATTPPNGWRRLTNGSNHVLNTDWVVF